MANDPYLEASGAWQHLSDDAKCLLSKLWIPNATTDADKASNEKVLASFMDTVKQQRLQKEQQLRDIYAQQAILQQQRQQLEREIAPTGRLAIAPPEALQARIEEVPETPHPSRRNPDSATTYTSNNGQFSNGASMSNGNDRHASYAQHAGGQASGSSTGACTSSYPMSAQQASGQYVPIAGYANTPVPPYGGTGGQTSTPGTLYNLPGHISQPPTRSQLQHMLSASQRSASWAQNGNNQEYLAQLREQWERQWHSTASRPPPIPNQATAYQSASHQETASIPSNNRPSSSAPPVNQRLSSQRLSQAATPTQNGIATSQSSRSGIDAQASRIQATPTSTSKPSASQQTSKPVNAPGPVAPPVKPSPPSKFLVGKPDYDKWASESPPGTSVYLTKALMALKLPAGRIKYRWKAKDGKVNELMFEPGLRIQSVDSNGIPTFDKQPLQPSSASITRLGGSASGISPTGPTQMGGQVAPQAVNGHAAAAVNTVATGRPGTIAIPSATAPVKASVSASQGPLRTMPAPSGQFPGPSQHTAAGTTSFKASSTPQRGGSTTSSEATPSPRKARSKTLVRDVIRMLGGKRPSEGGGEPTAKRRHVGDAGNKIQVGQASPAISTLPAPASASLAIVPRHASAAARNVIPIADAAPVPAPASVVMVRNDAQEMPPVQFIHENPGRKPSTPATSQPVQPPRTETPHTSTPVTSSYSLAAPPTTTRNRASVNPYFDMAMAWNNTHVGAAQAQGTPPPLIPTQPTFQVTLVPPSQSVSGRQRGAVPATQPSSSDSQSLAPAQTQRNRPSQSQPVAASISAPSGPSNSPNGPVDASNSGAVATPAKTPKPKRIDLAQKMKDRSSKKPTNSPSASFQFTPSPSDSQRPFTTPQQTPSQPIKQAAGPSRLAAEFSPQRPDELSRQPGSPMAPPPPPSSSAPSSPRPSPQKTPLFLNSRASTEKSDSASTEDSDAQAEHTVVVSRTKDKDPLQFDCVYISDRPEWVEEDMQRLRTKASAEGKRRREPSTSIEVESVLEENAAMPAESADQEEEAEVFREIDATSRDGSDDVFSVDEEDILRSSFIIPPANYNRHDPVEAEAVALSLSRARDMRCGWDKCEVSLCSGDRLLRHLVHVHLADEGSSFRCLWEGCTESYSSKRALAAHVENHARSPLSCAYENCEYSFKHGKQLSQHHEQVHARGRRNSLKPSTDPLKPNLDGLPRPPLPTNPPYWQHDTPPVRQFSITPQRHQAVGPKILANIYPYAKYTSLAALRRSLKQTDEFAFVEYKERRENRIRRHTRFEDLLSEETTELFQQDKAVLVWKGDTATVVLPDPPKAVEGEEGGEGGTEHLDVQLKEDLPEEKPLVPTASSDAPGDAPSTTEYIDLTADDM